MRFQIGFCLAVLSLLTSSCATMFTGGYKRVSVISDTPGAKFTATQERRETKELKTGETYWMKRNRSAEIKIEAPGYITEHTQILIGDLHPLFQASVGLLLVPAIVDYATGATNVVTSGVVKRSLVKLPPKVETSVGFRVSDMKMQIVEGKTRRERRNTVVPEAENVKSFENEVSLTWCDTLNHMLHQQGYKVPDFDKNIFTSAYSAKYKLSPVVKRIEVKDVSNNDAILTTDITWRLLSRADDVVWSKDVSYGHTFHNYGRRKNYLFINVQGSLCKLMNEQQAELAQYLTVKENQPLEEEKLAWIELPKPSATTRAVNKVTKSVVTVVTNDGHGSGSIVSDNGYILTNYHVVLSAKKIEVSYNGELVPATLVRKNEDADLALLKIEKSGLQPISVVGQDSLEIGTEVFAIGTPSDVSLGQTVTKGIVSAIRTVDNAKIIQTDVAINSGNSGGALVSTSGILVGIPNAKLNRAEGIGICIPAAYAFKRIKLKYTN